MGFWGFGENDLKLKKRIKGLETDALVETLGVIFYSCSLLFFKDNLCLAAMNKPLTLFVVYIGLMRLPITIVQILTL